ncbi:MAG: phosphoglycerate mutase [Burkholderiales bacterium]|nr:phosphoglycerate mutase [Burkholderiales bacterium]
MIPGLFWPDASFRIDPLPALETLLARGEMFKSAKMPIEEWLCRAFGVKRQKDWPVAPFFRPEGARGYRLRADPVHLQLMRDRFVLIGGELLPVSGEETARLIETLNRHFAEDGFQFSIEQGAWILEIPEDPGISTTPLSEVMGRDISKHLPQGEDAMRWNHVLNEIQMLLHDHPVNEEREKRGELPVNSLWLWGGGSGSETASSGYASVRSNDPLANLLAARTGIPCGPVPEDAENWISSLAAGEHLLVLGDLFLPIKYRDENEWDGRLRMLEQQWFSPLHQAVQEGLSLTLSDCESGLGFGVEKLDLWKFWKRIRPLLEHPA